MRNLAQRHWKVLFLFCLVGMDLVILDLSPWMGLMVRFRRRFPMASAFSGGAPLLWVVNRGLMVGLIGFGTYRNAARLSWWTQVVRRSSRSHAPAWGCKLDALHHQEVSWGTSELLKKTSVQSKWI